MRSTLWSSIDPDSEWRTAPEGGYTDLSGSTVPAAAKVMGGNLKWGPLNVDHPHFVFGALLLGTGALIYWIYEGKPSGVSGKANVGPVGAAADIEIE